MTFHLIGLGLSKNSISAEALHALTQCTKIYLETYTVDFPYTIEELEQALTIKITPLNREQVENESIIEEAKDIALLVYGDPLTATTHTHLIVEAKKQNIPYRVFHNASILSAIAQTGLSPYKFGKTTSMPDWKEHTNRPTSFAEYIRQNQSINAHTLLLTDIGLDLKQAIEQLEESKVKIEKLIVLSHAGTNNQKILVDLPKNLTNESIKKPFCIIIPGELSHTEEEALHALKLK